MGPLTGIRVADLTWGYAGPKCTVLLSFMGAQVIKVESSTRPDLLRADLTALGTAKGTYASFNAVNLNKLSVTLNLKRPEAVEIVKRLVKISDVVVDNFSPGVTERLGLDYPVLKEVNPRLIGLSISSSGATGPERHYKGWAASFGPLSGLSYVTGYPDSEPAEIRSGADIRVGTAAAFAILAALVYRNRTGVGQHIDVSSREALTCLIGEVIMDYTMNGNIQSRKGNRDDIMVPHSCYRCRGEDSWVSIAVSTEQEWRGLCSAMGDPDWSKDPKFSDTLSRWYNQEELDKRIESWTISRDAFEVMNILQEAGVAAMPSFSNRDLWESPHLRERGIFREVEHPELGKQVVLGPPWKLSAGPDSIHSPAPLLGQHNEYVLKKLLGMPQSEFDRLIEQGVIS